MRPLPLPGRSTLSPLTETCGQPCPTGSVRVPNVPGAANEGCFPITAYCQNMGERIAANGEECEGPCRSGQTRNSAGVCVADCPASGKTAGGGTCTPPTCPLGTQLNAQGECAVASNAPPGVPGTKCPPNEEAGPFGTCLPKPAPCSRGQTRDAAGACVAACPASGAPPGGRPCTPPTCPSGQQLNAAGECEAPPPPSPCPAGQTHSIFGACLPNSKSPTPPPPPRTARRAMPLALACHRRRRHRRHHPVRRRDAQRRRRLPTTTHDAATTLPAGQTRNAAGVCVTAVEPPCPTGEVRNSAGTCAKAT